MKLLLTLILSSIFSYSLLAQNSQPVDYVNALMGTDSKYELSNGNTYPAIARPWGMNFWTPQTNKMGDGWVYQYSANKIRGFKQTHQPSPWINDYGQFSLMPIVGEIHTLDEKRGSWFSHKAEEVKPYYYKVYLADYDVTTELTPTDRAAIFRFTFPKTDHAHIIVDAFDKGSYIKVLPKERKVVGYTTKNSGGVPNNFRNYFVVQFSHPFSSRVWDQHILLPDEIKEITGEHAGAVLSFVTQKGEVVEARVASSFISLEQAERNLSQELQRKSFNTIVSEGRAIWNALLSRITVKSDNTDQLRTFYTTLYRSLLFPRKFYEYNAQGKPIHYSPYNGKIVSGYLYTDTGFWDTFRSLFPLLNFIFPSEAKKMQDGLLNAYNESGFFPEWASPGHRDCMIGNNSASVIADAFLEGIITSQPQALEMYQGLLHGANNVHPNISSTGRKGHEYYNRLGYIPYNVGINENAARTLEYAYADWCIYQMGKKLGRPASELEVYKRRALNYRNLFDPSHRLMRGKNEDGSFQSPFNPLKWGDAFTEGNSWHYSWSVFHDVQGLINLMGGKEPFVSMLDSVFSIPPLFDESYYGSVIHEIREMQIMNMGNYAHGNQPIQHMIYLYNYAGEPWKAQYWLRKVMDKLYTPTPDGYCGDEDNGQTSAWYVFSTLGFYPVCPGSGQYVIGSPLFKETYIHLENGKTLEILAPNNTGKTPYIHTLSFNGKCYPHNYFDINDLKKGGKLLFTMSATPNLKRGREAINAPYSLSKAEDTSEILSSNKPKSL